MSAIDITQLPGSVVVTPKKPQLAEVLGSAAPISRPQVAKKVWAYIKKHKLQDPKKRREIIADDKLKPVFGKTRLDMFQMTKAISKHLSK